MTLPPFLAKLQKTMPVLGNLIKIVAIFIWIFMPAVMALPIFVFGISFIVLLIEILIPPHHLSMLSPSYLHALFLSGMAYFFTRFFTIPILGNAWNSTDTYAPYVWIRKKSAILWETLNILAVIALVPLCYIIFYSTGLVLRNH